MLYSHITFAFVVALMAGSSLATPSPQDTDDIGHIIDKRAPEAGDSMNLGLERREETKPKNPTSTSSSSTSTTTTTPTPDPKLVDPEEPEFPDETGETRSVDVPEENGHEDDDDDDDDDDSDDEDEKPKQ